MGQEQGKELEQQLQAVPKGSVAVVRHSPAGQADVLLTDRFSARTAGKGRLDVYQPLPGVEAAYNCLIGGEIAVHHAPSRTILELFYCRRGRVGWNMRGGTAVYLGAGDLSIHSADCCAESRMLFPLGYAEGVSVSVDLAALEAECPPILREAGVDLAALQATFCTGKPVAVPACRELEAIFAPVYAAPDRQRKAYLALKTMELLLYLSRMQPRQASLTQYESRQTEVIREIHRQLTARLDRRFTIEELARKYLMNTSTLKEVFKAVYGQPIGTYMKEYRIGCAMQLLRETGAPISEIARRVGYKTQGKFTKAFKDVTRMLPTEYRSTAGAQTPLEKPQPWDRHGPPAEEESER